MILGDFAGLWRIERTIDDRRAALQGRLTGRASLLPQGDRLLYREEGMLTLGGGQPVTATRDYIWSQADGRIVVSFADGRPFHDFDPGAAAARHFCAPDTYAVHYDFTRWPDWQTVWEVSGPRKNYRMQTWYSRG